MPETLRLFRAAHRMGGAFWKAAIPEMGYARYRVLRAVSDLGSGSQSALKSRADVDKSTIGPILDGLMGENLIHVKVGNSRRSGFEISLSSEGEDRLSMILKRISEMDMAILSGISKEDAHVLLTIMEKLVSSRG